MTARKLLNFRGDVGTAPKHAGATASQHTQAAAQRKRHINVSPPKSYAARCHGEATSIISNDKFATL